MEIKIYHEGFIYCVEAKGNQIVMYKNDIDEWMGDIEHIKVFTIEGDTPNPVGLYRKLTRAFIDVIKADRAKWYYFNVTDEKRADLYERVGKTVKGYNFQRAEKCFYLHRQ